MEIVCADPNLKMFFRTHLAISALGRELLASRPGMVLIVAAEVAQPTHFNGRPEPTIHINRAREDARGSRKEIASAMVHEVIHAIHRFDDENAYRTRNATDSQGGNFTNQEEELTITGQVLGTQLRSPLCCENWARRCMGLNQRANH